jgi:formylglycine-generating enzyme
MRKSLPLLLSLSAAAYACGAFDEGEADSDRGDAGTDASVDADVDAASADGAADGARTCPSGRGPEMLHVTPVGLPSFCIDATEVTRAQYDDFLRNGPPSLPSNQIAKCAANDDFKPAPTVDLDAGDLPVGGVDWCDAYAFCAWAGKRLCGQLGDGGPISPERVLDSHATEWGTACTHRETRSFPYGNTFEPAACNIDKSDGGGVPHPVSTLPTCQGGYDGLFDMVGNVSEWQDSCDDGAFEDGGTCAMRGGAYTSAGTVSCNYLFFTPARLQLQHWGLRCCATPQ